MLDQIIRILTNPQTWLTVLGIGGAILEARKIKKASDAKTAKLAEKVAAETKIVVETAQQTEQAWQKERDELKIFNKNLMDELISLKTRYTKLDLLVDDYFTENRELKAEISQLKGQLAHNTQVTTGVIDKVDNIDHSVSKTELAIADIITHGNGALAELRNKGTTGELLNTTLIMLGN